MQKSNNSSAIRTRVYKILKENYKKEKTELNIISHALQKIKSLQT